MEKFSKFIIEDGKLILMKVTFHKDIVTDPTKVKGGGWFRFLQHTDTFVFFGDSHDFGPAKFEDIKSCVENSQVYSDNRFYRNISKRHNFGYDTGSEIIELKTIKGIPCCHCDGSGKEDRDYVDEDNDMKLITVKEKCTGFNGTGIDED